MRPGIRVEKAFHGVDEVTGDHLATFTVWETFVIGIEDAFFDAVGVGQTVFADLRHGFREAGLQFVGTGEIFILIELVVNARRHQIGILGSRLNGIHGDGSAVFRETEDGQQGIPVAEGAFAGRQQED